MVIQSKHIILKLYLIFGVIGFLCSCTEDSRNHNMVDDSVYLKDSRLNIISVFNWGDFNYKLIVVKSGVGQQSAHVQLRINESLLTKFNSENNTNYKSLPADLYEMKNTDITFSKNDYLDDFEIIINSYRLKELLETTGQQYAISCEIILSNTSIVSTSEEALYSIVVPQIKEPYIQFDKTGLVQPVINLNPGSESIISNNSLVKINYFNTFGDIEFTIDIDPQVLENYNASANEDQRIDYPIIHQDAIRFRKDSWGIPDKNNETYAFFDVLKDAFFKNGEYLFGNYALPLKLTTVNMFNINPLQRTQLYQISFLPQNLDRSQWEVIEVSSEEVSDGGGKNAILDGKPETYWHNRWRNNEAPLPHYLIIDMKKEYQILGFEIMRRLEYTDTKVIKLELSLDGITYNNAGQMDFGPSDLNTETTMSISVTPARARYIKCIITESNRPPSASIAELNVKGVE